LPLPTYITHYFEADYGPFLNLCDLEENEVSELFEREKDCPTAFNRFAMGEDFLRWRRSADDLLIRAYAEKFGIQPNNRPYFAVLGEFDKTLSMFRQGRKMRLELSDFAENEITFMYPDHSHLTQYYGAEVPHLFYQLHHFSDEPFLGRVYTYQEFVAEYHSSRISDFVAKHVEADGWAGCYVEAHLWCRDQRTASKRIETPKDQQDSD